MSINNTQITYTREGGTPGDEDSTNVLRFHSIESESHTATAEVTKYVVQTGFELANNSIRKNRTVELNAYVSNTVVIGQSESHTYGANNSKSIFAELERLVNDRVPCIVDTNLGQYDPVIFTKFTTKQDAKMINAMQFVISGEEVQVSTVINKTAPAALQFRPVPDNLVEARKDELRNAGLEVKDTDELKEAPIVYGKSFTMDTVDSAGNPQVTTYEYVSTNETDGSYLYKIHTTNTEVYKEPSSGTFNVFGLQLPDIPEIPSYDDIASKAVPGLSTAASCIGSKTAQFAVDYATDFINTAVGDLQESIYGAVYELSNIALASISGGIGGNSEIGQALIDIGVECAVAGVVAGSVETDLSDSFELVPDVPSVDDMIASAETIGADTVNNSVDILTKVVPGTTSSNPEGLLGSIGLGGVPGLEGII